MKKLVAEFIGTFTLVFFGVGSAVLAGPEIGFTGISLAFGISIVAIAYGLGAISGAHLNPAVSLGAMLAGRQSSSEMIQYWIAQVAGAIAAYIIIMILGGAGGAGANAPGEGINFFQALVFEIVATFIFVTVILGATDKTGHAALAGLAIGLTLTGIHLVGIPLTGTSVNPARSIAPALFGGGATLAPLWIFIVGPFAGAALAGVLNKAGITDASAK